MFCVATYVKKSYRDVLLDLYSLTAIFYLATWHHAPVFLNVYFISHLQSSEQMATKKWVCWLLLIFLCLCCQSSASHFMGGTIQWRPLDAQNFNGTVRERE